MFVEEEGAVYRLAKLSDFAAVKGINEDMYSGMDYLPSLYHSLLQTQKNLISLVAELHGKIVSHTESCSRLMYIALIAVTLICKSGYAFQVSYLFLDVCAEDKRVTVGARRTKTGYMNEGHNTKLMKHGMNYVRWLFPNTQLVVYAVANSTHPFWNQAIKSGDWTAMYHYVSTCGVS